MNEVELKNELKTQENRGFMDFSNTEEAIKWAQMIADSNFCPQEFKGKSGDVLVAIQYGSELGLKPLQSLQNIWVVNGKPAIYGDAIVAICRSSGKLEYLKEAVDLVDGQLVATCEVKRKGEPVCARKFSQADAQQAGLWNKQGPWRLYPWRMLQARARGFAFRDTFADYLRGMISIEEARDMEDIQGDNPIPENNTITILPEAVKELLAFISNDEEKKLRVANWLKRKSIRKINDLTEVQANAILSKLKESN